MFVSVPDFPDGLLYGKIGIADFILDHLSARFGRRPPVSRGPSDGLEKTHDDINKIKQGPDENQPE